MIMMKQTYSLPKVPYSSIPLNIINKNVYLYVFSLKNYQALNNSNHSFDFCKQESIVSCNGCCEFLTTSLHWYSWAGIYA